MGKPLIWLCNAEGTWVERAIDDQGTLSISRIAARANLRLETLLFGKQGAYEGITIEDVKEVSGLTAGDSEDSAVLVGGTPKPAQGTSGPFVPQKLIGSLAEGMNARMDYYCTMRVKTALKICELVDRHGALLIRAPPGSGKTSLLQLVEQVITPKIFRNVYYISLADLGSGDKTFEELWKETHPGVDLTNVSSPPKHPGRHSEPRPTLLLVDEGQVAFSKDLSLWGTLKGVMGGSKKHLRIIVVSAWGSDAVVEGGVSYSTPVGFRAESTVSLWPTEASTVALQLTEDEATELWNGWCQKGLGNKLVSCVHLRDYIFILTGRQPGLMVHVLDWLLRQSLGNVPACSTEEKARSLLLSPKFYDSLSSLRSLFRLSEAVRGQRSDAESMRSLVRRLLADECVPRRSLSDIDRVAADLAVKWGHVVDVEGSLRFPSQLHRHFLFREVYCRKDSTSDNILKEGLLAFVRRVIERLDPRRLHLSASRSAADNRVYERQYQIEFYRAACTVIPDTAVLSPDAGHLFGAKGYLDYLLSPYSWGFELLRDGAELKEHTERFGPGGVYNKLLRDKVIEDYVILDLRMKPLSKPIQFSHAVHVVFSNDFKTATLHTLGSEPESLHVRGEAI